MLSFHVCLSKSANYTKAIPTLFSEQSTSSGTDTLVVKNFDFLSQKQGNMFKAKNKLTSPTFFSLQEVVLYPVKIE